MSDSSQVIKLLSRLIEAAEDNSKTTHEILKAQKMGYNTSLQIFVVIIIVITNVFYYVNLNECTESNDQIKYEVMRLEIQNKALETNHKELLQLFQDHEF